MDISKGKMRVREGLRIHIPFEKLETTRIEAIEYFKSYVSKLEKQP